MIIQYMGHACFMVTSSEGVRILTDPYNPGGFDGAIGYGPIQETPDIVIVTHEHEDHNSVASVPGQPLTVRQSATARGIEFDFIEADHDEAGGSKRGKVKIALFQVDGYRLGHFSDLGRVLTNEQLEAIGSLDVAFIPVGGKYTIGPEQAREVVEQLKPGVVIPMHYKTARIGFPLAPVGDFLRFFPKARKTGRSELEIAPNSLPPGCQVVVLEPAN